MNAILEHLSVLIQTNFCLAPVLALFAGILTSVPPVLFSVSLLLRPVWPAQRKKILRSRSFFATPVLIALFGMVACSGKPAWGTFLLLRYSIGHSILALFAGTFTGFTRKITQNNKYGVFSKIANILLGLVILLTGLFLVYSGL